MASGSSGMKGNKAILRALGIMFVIAGLVLMFSRFFWRERYESFGTYAVIFSMVGGFVLFFIGFVLIRWSKSIDPYPKDTPPAAPREFMDPDLRKGSSEVKVKVGEDGTVRQYDRTKMNKFLIDPEDMKKKKK